MMLGALKVAAVSVTIGVPLGLALLWIVLSLYDGASLEGVW